MHQYILQRFFKFSKLDIYLSPKGIVVLVSKLANIVQRPSTLLVGEHKRKGMVTVSKLANTVQRPSTLLVGEHKRKGMVTVSKLANIVQRPSTLLVGNTKEREW